MNRLILIFNSLASIGVLIGLALVVLQLNQAEEFAKQDRILGYFTADSSTNLTVIGEDFAETLVRIQTAPETVTQADLVRFDHWATNLIGVYTLVPNLLERENICDNFGSEIGRHYVDWMLEKYADDKTMQKMQDYLSDCTSSKFLEYMSDKGT